MIHSFSCKNFYSFPDVTTVDFTVNDQAPANNGYFETQSGGRLSKIETVIGANASGKTNLLKALPFLKWLITDSFISNPAEPLPLRPFMFGEQKNKPMELSVDFEINGDVYSYSFALDAERILSEELRVKNKSNQKVTSKKVVARVWNEKINAYELEDKHFGLPKNFENALRTNASIISGAIRFNHEESKKIADFWESIETNVVEAGWVSNTNRQLAAALNFYSEEENEAVKKKAEKLLAQFDLGLEALDISKKKTDEGVELKVRVAHSFGGKTEYLPMEYESAGTKQLFILLKAILVVLDKGGIAVLDEFDVNLHPDMVETLFDLFIQPETNPKNAQLLFSTHSHRILSKLDKYQIILIEKNENGGSDAWRLDEMAGVRADDNYYAKYIAGAYGAIPKL
ncbi:MAG: hypothetical protein ACD_81C00009G0003 [uncultured bacterium]|uniref:ATPase AAA-type core domain-containing protein n=1 Tax=Candidatus Wolfebacteria bacterium GW2011_GWC2_39_22 TaxID=1619013 RepID=A0A0G0RF45_9BACT|nr:MAG: hypothetical protein ACD_81C00009G0003 [uncultured bacterium]KKR12277.1 MAG: hypothetical protein UT41_C0002G0051 [Candidatus Wolfebacteria bacterium GW2011_GWC2_39_22]HBI25908.1 hypothetical protein [Candidatus Wolfebacteria bacterium]